MKSNRSQRMDSHAALQMKDCPKFDRCSAPICPLDPDVFRRVYLPGEAICFYLAESVKPGAEARFRQVHSGNAIWEAIRALDPPLSRYALLRKALQRAKRTPPRMGRVVGKKVGDAA